MNTKDQQAYCIIGGTTKAGTTSLFKYLGDHPEMCASSMKETRFFLELDYPLDSKYRFEDGVDKYMEYYNGSGEGIRAEATPDYLHSAQVARRAKTVLGNVKFIFTLREPVSRMVSWFNFAKQAGLLEQECSFEKYITQQMENPLGTDQQHMMTLQQGRYSLALQSYYDILPKEDIHIIFYEHMKLNVKGLMQGICRFLDIDPDFYETYDFQRLNKTISVKNQGLHKLYMEKGYRLRQMVHDKKAVHNTLRKINKWLYPLYMKFNGGGKVAPFELNEEMKSRLQSYYAEEYSYFMNNFDDVPWPSIALKDK